MQLLNRFMALCTAFVFVACSSDDDDINFVKSEEAFQKKTDRYTEKVQEEAKPEKNGKK